MADKNQRFYGKKLEKPRAFYFAENEFNNKIIISGSIYWRDKNGHHWTAPIDNPEERHITNEPPLDTATCYIYRGRPMVNTQ